MRRTIFARQSGLSIGTMFLGRARVRTDRARHLRLLLVFPIISVVASSFAQTVPPPAPQDDREQAREMLRTLIGFRTSVGLGQVPAMAHYLADQFRKGGFPNEDVHVLPLGETASLVVRYRGDGRGGKPILLLGHMDVVTAKPEEWERDPFTLIEENGFFYGRGTFDNKQGVTVLTATFLRLKKEGFVPTRDLIIAFTGDEETGMLTTRDLASRHRAIIDAEFALNSDDGTGRLDDSGRAMYLSIVGTEKVAASFDLTVRNPGGHSSAPRADNAIYELADALKAVQSYHFPVMTNDWTLGSFNAVGAITPGPLGDAMKRFAANPQDDDAANVLFNSPRDVGKTRTTCVATMLKGGHASNALAQTATATVNCRVFPGVKLSEVQATLQKLAGEKTEVRLSGPQSLPADASPLRKDVIAAVTKAAHTIHPGVPVIPDMASYGTDGSVLRAAGIPTYGVGGSFIRPADVFAHGLNERIPVESFYNALTYWHELLKEMAATGATE
jgi:acetylornithine deacetylase/succinyl-diaminopimelate desuccinylase-like protein